MAREKQTKFITKDILDSSIKGAFQKLDPRYMIKNPVMFVVEIGFFITLVLSIFPTVFGDGSDLRIYNIVVTVILFVTILFANFAESVAEGRGKAQAETLKKTKKDTTARLLDKNGKDTVIPASQLKKGDVVLVKTGELIPNDGEVIEGIASVDESAITGESAPVTREAGGDFALLVCLIPTTIGGLLSAIGIAGMDRVTRFNVIAMSGKAVEACGDVDTMILDKTGTITYGNRLAAEFYPVKGISKEDLIDYAVMTSLKDSTPEGKSVVELADTMGTRIDPSTADQMEFVEFTAQTKMSGVNLSNGMEVRKGASEAIKARVAELNGTIPEDLEEIVTKISKLGGTPLVVCAGNVIYGVIYLKDTVKPGLTERFERLRQIGIKTIMCTGDNPLTAATIAKEAGVDGFIAECKPEDKIEAIKKEQLEGKIVAMTGDGTNDAPALAQADVGLAMNSGTAAAKEAANMVDLDSDPTKILEVVEIGKQLLITRGSLTTFSIANDVAKYFAIIPAMFMMVIPQMERLNIMGLSSPYSAILSALIFNALIIPGLIPIAMRGVKYRPMSSERMLLKNMGIYGVGGIIVPFIGIKIIDLLIAPLVGMMGL